MRTQWYAICSRLCSRLTKDSVLPPLKDKYEEIGEMLAHALQERAAALNKGEILIVVDNVPEGSPPAPMSAFCPGWHCISVLATSRQHVVEKGVRNMPKGIRQQPSMFFILGEGSKADQTPQAYTPPQGYLERYEVQLKEEIDAKGKRYVQLPRLSPLNAYLLYNPDGYYR